MDWNKTVLLILASLILFLLPWPDVLAVSEPTSLSEDLVLISDGPLPSEPIVFVSRNRMETLNNIYVGLPVDVPGRELTPGGSLMIWRPDSSVTNLTAGTSLYDVQQPDVSFDGTKIVFSAVKGPRQQWHLYEIGVDGQGLRQLTYDDCDINIPVYSQEPDRNNRIFVRYGDFGPAYLPDGRIIFASTRYMTLSGSCGQRGQNLYVLNPQSGEIHRRTTERAGAMDSVVASDGTIIFSHWIDAQNMPSLDGPGLRPLEIDYNFVGSSWGIWNMNPDGTGAHRYAFLRGGLEDGGGAYQPHELPNGDLVVTFRRAGSLLGHTLANAITIIQPGPVESHELHFLGDPYNLEGPHSLAPAPLPDGRIVCSYTPTATVEVDPIGRTTASFDFGLYVTNETLTALMPLYNRPDTDELDAVVIYSRSAPVIPDCADADDITDDPTNDLGYTALMINHNVYADLPLDIVNLPSPKAGTVARIDVYDDSQTFFTSNEFPLIRKQMPRFYGSFPVDKNGSFSATVPADKPFLFVLVNENGVAVRSPISPKRPRDRGYSLTHTFNGHDYLRPNDVIHCAGCHKGHMLRPVLAMEAKTNLARLSIASSSSEQHPFNFGAWRINDLHLADEEGRFAWKTYEGPGAWIQLTWTTKIKADQAVLYPLNSPGGQVISGWLEFSDGAKLKVGPLPTDGSPLVIPFNSTKTISWVRFTVDQATGFQVGLAELAINGPPDIDLPDIAPLPPTNLFSTEGVLYLQWAPVLDPGLAGYKIYYGTSPRVYTDSVDVGNVSRFIMRDLLQNGITYYVAAKAYNVYNTESIFFSNEVSATVKAPVVLSIEPDHGPVGGFTPITIFGRNFASRDARVTLGGKHAFEVRVVDETTITALTHWHKPGTVDVVVSNPDDQSGTLPDGFTYEKIK